MKRWDLVAFVGIAVVPLAMLAAILARRDGRIPALAAELPVRLEQRLGPIRRPAHAPGDGAFGSAAFADLAALSVHEIPADATRRLRLALREGGLPPAEYVALAEAERGRIERILRSSKAPQVDPPASWRFSSADSGSLEIGGGVFARLAATLAVLSPSSAEAVGICVDAAGVARDLAQGSGLMGSTTKSAVLNVIEPPCRRLLLAAPPEVRGRAREALERIAAALPLWRQVVEYQGLDTELILVGQALPLPWFERLPGPVGTLFAESRHRDPLPLWNRAVRLDAWPDLREATAEVARKIEGADAAARKAAYVLERARLQRSPNPLLGTILVDLERFDDRDVAGRAALERLALAAR